MLRKSSWAIALLLAVPLLRPAAAAPPPSSAEALQPLASLSAAGTTVDWQPRFDGYDRLILTVAGPKGLTIRQEFEAEKYPSLNLSDKAGQPWPDGDYSYELRLVPKAAALDRPLGGQASDALYETRLKNGSILQIGALSLREGRVALPDLAEISAPAEKIAPPDSEGAVQRTVVTPPLIVQGDACIGEDCLSNEVPFDLLLKRDQPSIDFEDTSGGDTGDSDWRLLANEIGTGNNFAIKEVISGASTRPFVVESGAPGASIFVRQNGNIGLGTFPQNRLHLYGSAGTTKMLIQEANLSTNFRELLELRNNGGPVLIFKDTSLPQRWGNGTLGSSFVMDEQAHAGIELTLTNTGNLTVLGTVTPGSSREIKHGFSPVDQRAVLDRVVALPITSWEYNADQNVRHIGPMAEDFYSAFQVGADNKGISVTDSAGVAFAAIQGLYALVAEKDAKLAQVEHENVDLAQRNRDLDERLTRLEAKLSALGGSPVPAIPAQ